ncbi:MAG TPA: NAD+ synthase [Desulfomonilaceae bacterium]|nr:NAD+ synthase [Desulfomonilaceae bacterium]
MTFLRIAQAQINSVVGDFSANCRKIAAWIEKAKSAQADVVLFPELALSGYPPEDLLLKHGFVEDNHRFLEYIVGCCRGLTALVGFAHGQDGKVYNAAALISDAQLKAVYHKIELPNYGVFDEKRYFQQGSGCLIFDMEGVRFSVTICEDIWIQDSVTCLCASNNDADVVLNISSSPYFVSKLALRRKIVATFAASTNCTVFYNNLVGGQDELVFDGGSMVVNARGELVASAKRFEEDLLLTDIETGEKATPRREWNLSVPVITLQSSYTDRNYSPSGIAAELGRIEEVYQALLLGTRDYVRKNGFKRVVIGLSGGIDSALTAALAVDALGKEQVVAVTMPSQYTSDETFSDAELVARNLDLELIKLPVHDILQAYLSTLKEPLSKGEPGVEGENLQARIRGNLLMALSNRFGWLVLTTGNKSETAVGYCTLYGDMAGGFAVIKDVPKTLVYELAEYANRKAGKEIIPASVIARAPSAELRPDQKDEDSLPPYPVLDPILQAYVEEDKAPNEIIGFDPQLVWDIVRMVDRNEYKRRQAPPGVKITPKAFGKDRRLPITNKYLTCTDGDSGT